MPSEWTKLDEMASALSELLDWHERRGYDVAEGRADAGADDGLSEIIHRARAALGAYPGSYADDNAAAAFAGIEAGAENEKGAAGVRGTL